MVYTSYIPGVYCQNQWIIIPTTGWENQDQSLPTDIRFDGGSSKVKEIPDHFGPVAEGSMALPEFQVYRLPGLKTINSFTKTPLLYCFLFFWWVQFVCLLGLNSNQNFKNKQTMLRYNHVSCSWHSFFFWGGAIFFYTKRWTLRWSFGRAEGIGLGG